MLIKFKNFRHRLRRQLASTKRHKQLQDQVSTQGKGFGRSEWVLSRPLYRYAQFDLKSVPKPQRGQALELQIRQWTPFGRTGWYLLWHNDNALIWAWDADRIEEAIQDSKLRRDSTTVVPETLLHPGQEQGVHLVACMEGVEGQVWSEHSLISSRWWPGLPNAGEWVNFQRDAGTLPEHQSNAVPTPLPLHWEEKPWARSAALGRSALYGAKAELWVVPVAALCLFAASMWYGAQLIKLHGAIGDQAAALESLNRQAGPIIEARGLALEALSRIKALQAIDPYPDQLSLLGKVAEALPKDGAYLKEWEFLNDKLKLLIASPNKIVSTDTIKLFQSLAIFKDVQVAPNNDSTSLALSMEVLPQAEIKFAAEIAGAAKKEGAPR